jgi:transcriptional regulator with GAF, ATPase, and Fis domain
MEPKLVALTGPLKGETFPVVEKITVGRDASNTVHISDVSVSRQHCVVNQGKLFDLDSLNGTFVNGIPVKERVLQHGDRVDVGSSQFLFVVDGDDAQDSIQFSEVEIGPSTIFLKKEDFESGALWKFSSEIHLLRKTSDIQRRFMELVFEAIPAESGAIVLAEKSVEDYSSIFPWDRTSENRAKVRISRTIGNLVLSKGESVLSNDVLQNFGEAKSLVDSGVRSVLAAPLFLRNRVAGLVYLEASGSSAFSGEHLGLLSAMAAIASIAFENLQHLEWLVEENRKLRNETEGSYGILGESPKIQEVLQFINKVGATDSTVLILGESGTGKELVARALHEKSPRANNSFVAINCAALTESLLESELFGHEKGAFTGAIAQKKGKFEVADGGTLFLDEVLELTPLLQAKLLRVLQERQFERVGGTQPIRVNIRVLAATNKNLKDAIKEGKFRDDLYYRLNVLSVQLPPLRERPADISLLATYFASQFGIKFQKRIIGISPEARARLMNYNWPGNVRELQNAIEHAVVLGNAEHILPEDLPDSLLESKSAGELSKYHEGVQEIKKQLILQAMENARGNFTEAAKLLGVHPNYLHRLIRNLDLRHLISKKPQN